jgi:hypothetical protein
MMHSDRFWRQPIIIIGRFRCHVVVGHVTHISELYPLVKSYLMLYMCDTMRKIYKSKTRCRIMFFTCHMHLVITSSGQFPDVTTTLLLHCFRLGPWLWAPLWITLCWTCCVALGTRLLALRTSLITLGARLVRLGARLVTLGARFVTLGARFVRLGARLVTLGTRHVMLLPLTAHLDWQPDYVLAREFYNFHQILIVLTCVI